MHEIVGETPGGQTRSRHGDVCLVWAKDVCLSQERVCGEVWMHVCRAAGKGGQTGWRLIAGQGDRRR
eukprot:1470220-Rhodomonas_salina.3